MWFERYLHIGLAARTTAVVLHSTDGSVLLHRNSPDFTSHKKNIFKAPQEEALSEEDPDLSNHLLHLAWQYQAKLSCRTSEDQTVCYSTKANDRGQPFLGKPT